VCLLSATTFRLIGELSVCLALTARACGLTKSLIDENYSNVWCCAVQSCEIVPALSGSFFPPAHSATSKYDVVLPVQDDALLPSHQHSDTAPAPCFLSPGHLRAWLKAFVSLLFILFSSSQHHIPAVPHTTTCFIRTLPFPSSLNLPAFQAPSPLARRPPCRRPTSSVPSRLKPSKTPQTFRLL
jgi:hypothetical protein